MSRTLLVIDDNESVRECLRYVLMHHGYKVLTAEGGPEAIALAAQHAIDGALIDVNMPGMNGIEVCTALHAQAASARRTLGIWLMTGARTTQVEQLGRAAGALDVLSKPFDLQALLRRLEEFFSRTPPAGGEPRP